MLRAASGFLAPRLPSRNLLHKLTSSTLPFPPGWLRKAKCVLSDGGVGCDHEQPSWRRLNDRTAQVASSGFPRAHVAQARIVQGTQKGHP